MDHGKKGNRSYNEKEIGRLIQRATELHESATGESDRNLSLREIEHIASELGLPREHLQAAALELEDSLNSAKPFRLWSGLFVIDETRVVGETMTEEQWEDIVLQLRRFTGREGKISTLGRNRQWVHALGEGDNGINFAKTQVTMRPGDGYTSIQIRKNFRGVAILYAIPLLLGIFFMGVLLTEPFDLVKFAFAGGSLIGALVVVRTWISSWSKRQKGRFKILADRLQETIRVTPSTVQEVEPTKGQVGVAERDESAPELIELPEQDESIAETDDREQVSPSERRGTRV